MSATPGLYAVPTIRILLPLSGNRSRLSIREIFSTTYSGIREFIVVAKSMGGGPVVVEKRKA
jgi:hypothetical protein